MGALVCGGKTMIVLTQAAVLLAWLALLGKFPITAITLCLSIVAWPAVRFFGEFFFGGLAAGLGLRLSGFGQAERSRPGHHFLAVTLVVIGCVMLWSAFAHAQSYPSVHECVTSQHAAYEQS